MNALRAVLAAALLIPSPALAAEIELGGVGERPVVAPIVAPGLNGLAPLSIETINVAPIGEVNLSATLGTMAASPLAHAAIEARSASAPGRMPATAAASAAAKLAETIKKAAAGHQAEARTTVGLAASLAQGDVSGVPAEERLNTAYDASYTPDGNGVAPPAAPTVFEHSRTAPLKKASRPSLLKRAVPLAVAALALATPALAQAAGNPIDGPSITSAHSLAWLSGIHPLVTAGAAILGAVIGLINSRRKDGEAPSAGDVLASIMTHGAIFGASAFVLVDLAQLAFVGPSIGLKPLSAALATAALGRTAFQGKFSDPNTTSADRIIGAFPAIAAAIGLSVGVSLAAPAMSYQLAMGAMAATGLATAIYAAVFKPGRSPADGPGLMGKGYVMQALFSGLALALSNWLVWPFTAMAVAGIGLVAWAFIRELLSLIPKKPATK